LIIQLEEAKRTLVDFEENLTDLGTALKVDKLKEDIADLEKQSSAETSGQTRKIPGR